MNFILNLVVIGQLNTLAVLHQLFIPNTNLTSVQEGMTYSGIKICNSLPNNILSLKNERKRFKT
jgi:hypothetical protein